MISVPASEFQKKFGRYKELAQTEDVIITSHERESVALISAAEYALFQEMKQRAATPLFAWEMEQSELEALEQAEIAAEAAQFNDEYNH